MSIQLLDLLQLDDPRKQRGGHRYQASFYSNHYHDSDHYRDSNHYHDNDHYRNSDHYRDSNHHCDSGFVAHVHGSTTRTLSGAVLTHGEA